MKILSNENKVGQASRLPGVRASASRAAGRPSASPAVAAVTPALHRSRSRRRLPVGNTCRAALLLVMLILCCCISTRAADKKIVLVAGRPSHGPGDHEFNAGVQL